jgi:predicted CxxxxCH...CXXCH cytochrome family protein
MLTRRTAVALGLPIAAALLASTVACGDARPIVSENGVALGTSCAACHGDGSPDVLPGDPRSAPPRDVNGRAASDPTATAIGAHQNHLLAGELGVAVACSECHVVPTTLLAPGHLDKAVTVTFGPLASKNGLSPTYDPATQTCSNVYCHGNFPFSKVTLPPTAPTWSGGGLAVACGTCHDLPPPPPAHVVVNVGAQGCGTSTNPVIACHPAPYSPTTVDPRLHIDGKVCPPFCTPITP